MIDARGGIVLPGFVDAHAHPVFAGNRADEFEERAVGVTYQEIAARGGGIKSTVRATRAANADELFESGKRYAHWFLRCGTTTVEAKSGYGLTLDDELKILQSNNSTRIYRCVMYRLFSARTISPLSLANPETNMSRL